MTSLQFTPELEMVVWRELFLGYFNLISFGDLPFISTDTALPSTQ
jgi:hypothetical protein